MSADLLLPGGLEQLLRMALVDPQLRAVLLGEDREATLHAARARGLSLDATCEAVLRSIPTEQLRLTLEQLQLATGAPTPPWDTEPAPVAGGIRPDDIPEQRWVSLGIQPDVPAPVSRGISPDLPPERPRGWWRRLFGK